MKPFLEALAERILVQDGAKGTALMARGLAPGELPDSWNLKHPDAVLDIHRSFVEAGCDILVTNTFGSVRPTLAEYKMQDQLEELNRAAVRLARQAGGGRVYVAASVPPIGQFLQPMGALGFDQAVDVYREQAEILESAGVDVFNIETASDLRETKAAIMAIRSVSRKPVVAMMSFGKDDRTLLGTTPQAAAIVLEAMGADVIGANCSAGVEDIYRVLLQMSEVSLLPKIAQPNAGLPSGQGSTIRHPLSPEMFADYVERLVEVGAGILGGCCGTTPAHVRAMRERLNELKEAALPRYSLPKTAGGTTWLCSRTRHVGISNSGPLVVIGERINPTRKANLRKALLGGDFEPVQQEGQLQVDAGAQMLDVNIGLGVEESGALMQRVLNRLESTIEVPLALDSSDAAVLEAGLREASGKVLINSVTAEQSSLDRVLPLVRRYGAAVIGLCLDEHGVPTTAAGRVALAERILEEAKKAGIQHQNVIIDPGTVSVAAQEGQAREILQAIILIKERLKLNTCLGLSNISHGLPNRPALNASFLSMALQAGLDAAILDPNQEPVMSSLRAGMVLCGRDPAAAAYVAAAVHASSSQTGLLPSEPCLVQENPWRLLRSALLSGDKAKTLEWTQKHLQDGKSAREIIDLGLLPAMDDLGKRFKARTVYLPQVMAAADSMQAAFVLLEPELQKHPSSQGPLLLLATVEGDVHDIGKNIVGAMLRASGFRLLDLGKSVLAQRIVTEAKSHQVALIGLSALMTTTMRQMPTVIEQLRTAGVHAPVLLGGAVVSDAFARSLGAHFAADAVAAVEVARALTHFPCAKA